MESNTFRFTSDQLFSMRSALGMSRPLLAHALNIATATIEYWEDDPENGEVDASLLGQLNEMFDAMTSIEHVNYLNNLKFRSARRQRQAAEDAHGG